jgi:predicted naringenin-chalcone synthase
MQVSSPVEAGVTLAPSACLAEIAGLGSAQPPFVLPQPDALALGLRVLDMSEPAMGLFIRVMSADGVETRHLGVEQATDLLETDHDRKLARFERWGIRLSADALQQALASAGLRPQDVDFLAITTCTGYLCPGLSAYVAEACGLRNDVGRIDIVGMGCGAALPALEQATSFLAAHPGGTAAVVCTEICSAAMLIGEAPDLIVSNAIFADGSAAAILQRAAVGGAGDGAGRKGAAAPARSPRAPTGATAGQPAIAGCRPRIVAFRSLLVPEWRDRLRFRTEGGHLRNVLAKEVPVLAGEACRTLIGQLLADHHLESEHIEHWIIHAGGKSVLDMVAKKLRLPAAKVASARTVLRESGNMSSPTVLFVLAEEHRQRPPRPGERGILTSFGAGFAAHAALLEY